MLAKLWNVLKALGAALVPIASPKTWMSIGRWIRWPLHVALVLATMAVLTYINYRFDLARMLRAPVPVLRQVWLPLIFLLLYILAWLGWWLWRLFTRGHDDPSSHPDIDAAWDDAMAGLLEAGVDPTELPLFLILGKPRGGEDSLFTAGGVELRARQLPRRPDSPLYVSASSDAIFVTCAGASLIGRLASAAGEPAAASTAELDREIDRLHHLCRRISTARSPYCPTNGILVLLPYSATERDERAAYAGSWARRDLAALREGLGVDFPVLVAVCDLETAPGFSTFLSLLPADLRPRPMGREFPLRPDAPAREIPAMVVAAVRWIGEELLTPAILKLMRVDDGANVTRDAATSANASLYRFAQDIQTRQERLCQLVTRLIAADGDSPQRFGGFYYIATGRAADAEQAFAAEPFTRLVTSQNHVSWTASAVHEDTVFSRWATFGYAVVASVACAVALVGYFFWL